MRSLIPLCFLFFTSISSAITINTPPNLIDESKISRIIADKDFNVDIFHNCSIRLNDKYLPVKTFEKVIFSAESIFLSSDNTMIQFDLSQSNKMQLMLQLGKQKDLCAKRVREYRRHPAY